MQRFLDALSGALWGAPLLIFFLFTGIRFTLRSRLFQFRGIKTIAKTFITSLKSDKKASGISQFSAFCSVLGACIGTGNIVGVATALYSGGPGVVFWMIVSALFSMIIAYAENYLGAIYSQRYFFKSSSTGAFSYIENGLNMKGLSKIYAFLCLMSVFGMGNLTQSNSLTDSLHTGFELSGVYTSLVVALLSFLIIRGGIKRIAKLQVILVPVATVFYFIISFAVLLKFKENIIPAIMLIFKEAFTLKALNGYGIYKAMRYGIARGVFSNEAGLGSSTILHSQAKDLRGEAQGISAMLEVFIDTVLMCGLTSLVILVSTDISENNLFGAQLSALAYSKIGIWGSKGVVTLTAVFAFMSLSSCAFYGEKSIEYLFDKSKIKPYRFIYSVFVFIGGICSPQIIWQLADICNALMAIPNLFALNCLYREIEYPEKNNRRLI